ncbi:MAG: ADP-ribosylglycohydrolase family protein [Polyangiaceae bacterium]
MKRPLLRARFEGSLLGLALGDALGAPYESGPVERFVWMLMGRTLQGKRRWTDDTQMSLDLAESLIEKGRLDLDDLAPRFARGYRWSRGYGPGAARLLKRIARGAHWQQVNRSIYPEGSFGNGGAMRAPVIGLFFADNLEELVTAARASAFVTHAHPLGMEGAVIVAVATALALRDSPPIDWLRAAAAHSELDPFTTRLRVATSWLQDGADPDPAKVTAFLGNGIAAAESCVTALYLAARFANHPFEDLLSFIARAGGDADTIGAMAGGVWGAARGVESLPVDGLSVLEQRERIQEVAGALFAAAG